MIHLILGLFAIIIVLTLFRVRVREYFGLAGNGGNIATACLAEWQECQAHGTITHPNCYEELCSCPQRYS